MYSCKIDLFSVATHVITVLVYYTDNNILILCYAVLTVQTFVVLSHISLYQMSDTKKQEKNSNLLAFNAFTNWKKNSDSHCLTMTLHVLFLSVVGVSVSSVWVIVGFPAFIVNWLQYCHLLMRRLQLVQRAFACFTEALQEVNMLLFYRKKSLFWHCFDKDVCEVSH